MRKLLRVFPRSSESKSTAGYVGSKLELARNLMYLSLEGALGVSRHDFLARSRKHEVVRCRIIAAYLCKNLFKMNWKQCGKILERDHSTVIHDHNSHYPCYEQDYKDYQWYFGAVLGELLKLLMLEKEFRRNSYYIPPMAFSVFLTKEAQKSKK